jgi:hypothetical protein
MLLINESSVGAFLLTALYLIYLAIILCMSFISCTCWVPTISVLNRAIFPCYSNLLLRRRRWTGILRWVVLGYALPKLSFLWGYGVFRYFVSLRVVLVFKDNIYVIIRLYNHDIWLSMSTFDRLCGTIDLGSCILCFGIKLGMTTAPKKKYSRLHLSAWLSGMQDPP